MNIIPVNCSQYLDSQYFTKEPNRWMLAYRQEVTYGNTDTNNLIESWHRTFKKKFLNNYNQKFQDRVIYILVSFVLPFFQDKVRRQSVEAGEKSAEDRRVTRRKIMARAYAERWKEEHGLDNDASFIIKTSDTTLEVPHFEMKLQGKLQLGKVLEIDSESENDDSEDSRIEPLIGESGMTPLAVSQALIALRYQVMIDWNTFVLQSCSCPLFFQSRSLCRHIALALQDLPPNFKFQPRPFAGLLPCIRAKSDKKSDHERKESSIEEKQDIDHTPNEQITLHPSMVMARLRKTDDDMDITKLQPDDIGAIRQQLYSMLQKIDSAGQLSGPDGTNYHKRKRATQKESRGKKARPSS